MEQLNNQHLPEATKIEAKDGKKELKRNKNKKETRQGLGWRRTCELENGGVKRSE